MRTCLILLLGIVYSGQSFAIPNLQKTNLLYISTDEDGNKVFSDSPPKKGNYSIEKQNNIATVAWHKSPTLEPIADKKKIAKTQNPTRISKRASCDDKSKLIKTLEDKLKKTSITRLFDNIKDQLRKARWQYQKSCY